MSATFDADLDEFKRRITELQGSPTDYDKRYAVDEQSRFALDSVEQAAIDYHSFLTEGRRNLALSLFGLAVQVLSNSEDDFHAHVLDRMNRARARLGVALVA